ncbi:MAG: patatin-like phospholipase family protein [Pseudomonadota bacterium]
MPIPADTATTDRDGPTAPPSRRPVGPQPNDNPEGNEITPLQPRIGLALGGGGARGLAHILILEALDEMAIRPQLIAGTSIGAIFGAAYASGLSAHAIRQHAEGLLSRRTEILRQIFKARSEPLQRVLKIFQLQSALLDPVSLLDLAMPPTVKHSFEDLDIPLQVTAADFYTQDEVVFSTGALMPAVAASMTLPALFAPVRLERGANETLALLDGGLVNPLPFDLVEPLVDLTIAVNVSGAGRPDPERKPPSVIEAIVASSQIVQNALVTEKLKNSRPDILIDVDVGHFGVLDFHKLGDVLKAAQPAKAELKTKLSRILASETITSTEPSLRPPTNAENPTRTADQTGHRPRLADRLRGPSQK